MCAASHETAASAQTEVKWMCALHQLRRISFEQGDPIGLADRRLNRSAKVSLASQGCFIVKPNETAHAHFTPSTTSRKRIGAVLLIA